MWHVIGLQGTGSNDIVIEDAFVPDHRTHPFTSGSVTSDSPIYALPFSCLFTYGIAAPIIGMAEGALEDHIEHASARTRVAAARRVATEAWSQIRVADAASEVDAARAQLDRNFADMMDVAVAGGSFDVQLRARVRRDQVRAVQWCVSAIDRVFQNSGGSVLSVKNPVQRAWRDAHAGSLHNSNVPEPILSGYGAIALGLPPEDYPSERRSAFSTKEHTCQSTALDTWFSRRRPQTHGLTSPSILGCVASRDESGVVRVRLDEMPWRIEVRQGDAARLMAAGWEVRDGADLERVIQRLTDAGVVVEHASSDDADAEGSSE